MKRPEGGGDQLTDVVKRARPHRTEKRLEFGEGEFDRIEIGTVRREKAQVRAGLLDSSPDLRLFVRGEVVEYDDVAGTQRGHQDLVDIGSKRRVVDRPIEH